MRIRQTKPEFFKHVGLSEVSIEARYLFKGLWHMADCAGRLKDSLKLIKAEIFPYDEMMLEHLDSLLNELAEHDEKFIVRYQNDGKSYIEISSFLKHQHLMGNEAKAKSTYPSCQDKNSVSTLVNTSKYSVPTTVHISTTDIRSNGYTVNGITEDGNSLSDSEESNDEKKPSEEPQEFIELAEWFFDEIRKNNPTHKQPKFNLWAKDIRLIIQTDKRTTAEFKELFTWVQKDGFWRSNCLSPGKLREKWDQLWMKMKSPPKQPFQVYSTALPGNQITPAHKRQSGLIDLG